MLSFKLANVSFSRRAHSAAGEFVRLTVSDTGKGVSPQVLERLIESRLATKESSKGPGLPRL